MAETFELRWEVGSLHFGYFFQIGAHTGGPISICQGKFDNGENQKWEDGVLTAHCGIPLRKQIPLAALSITDEEDGMVGVAGGGGTMSSVHVR